MSPQVFPLQTARFIKIQLVGTDSLALVEVQVWGYPPIQSWQHFEGPRRWKLHYRCATSRAALHLRLMHWHSGLEVAAQPKGRMSAPLVKLGDKA